LIAPPTPPQLEADKAAIDESFEKAFALLDQLAKDTETLKSSEETRTERLDSALAEVESVILELKTGSRRREDETRRISDEVRGLKDLIPKAMEGQKENTDTRLKELNNELKSLKTLMGQRMAPVSTASPAPSPYGRMQVPSTTASPGPPSTAKGEATNGTTASLAAESNAPKPASVSTPGGVESFAQLQGRSGSPFSSGIPPGRASIPAWQMAAANKSSSSVNTNGSAQEGASGSTG
jgi:peroxin-14